MLACGLLLYSLSFCSQCQEEMETCDGLTVIVMFLAVDDDEVSFSFFFRFFFFFFEFFVFFFY